VIFCSEVRTTEALESLHSEWSELFDRCPSATVFQTPEWLLAWWRHFGGNHLATLVLRHREQLVGIAPLFVTDPCSPVTFLGTGISDQLDVLLEHPVVPAAARLILEYISRDNAAYPVCDLVDLCADSYLLKQPLDKHVERTVCEVCPMITLPDSLEAWNESLPSKLCKNLRRDRAKLAQCGTVAFERAELTNLDEYLDALFKLHHARWFTRNSAGVLATDQLRSFHQEVAPALLRRGYLRFYGLRFNGHLAAVLYCFNVHGRTSYYLGGFDPALDRFGPGTLLVGHAIEEAIREGAREFDFLRGSEAYKYRWGAVDRPVYRIRVFPNAPGIFEERCLDLVRR
jgi:CelD/BcsL family acetyltransferase involved in cellulose biosynthesis